MAKIFTITEHRLIRSLLSSKTDGQIAGIIGCSEPEMVEYISKLTGVTRRPVVKAPRPPKLVKEKKISLKRLEREAEKARQKKAQAERKRVSREHERQLAKRRVESRSAYKTIPFDPSGKIQVRLNAKTLVWVKPGTDIEALKKKLRIS